MGHVLEGGWSGEKRGGREDGGSGGVGIRRRLMMMMREKERTGGGEDTDRSREGIEGRHSGQLESASESQAESHIIVKPMSRLGRVELVVISHLPHPKKTPPVWQSGTGSVMGWVDSFSSSASTRVRFRHSRKKCPPRALWRRMPIKLIGDLLREHAAGTLSDDDLLHAVEKGVVSPLPDGESEVKDPVEAPAADPAAAAEQGGGGMGKGGGVDEFEEIVEIPDSQASQECEMKEAGRLVKGVGDGGAIQEEEGESAERGDEEGQGDTMRHIQGLDCAFPSAREFRSLRMKLLGFRRLRKCPHGGQQI